ncbi:hypothetical protein [Aeoliella mucimassa]|uniref:Uncharacterized protein n=1 Tax=Aeoliella mucimassa TaxID=2527972 RepID=A0A518ALD0_9BACT|nr:hypothetical protein [Aeoliella mucimassa]QDU55540.1 hypothetical protein Pan181_17320 [Aeoliella mucimassa]
MQLPQTLTICGSKYFLDGGTTILEAIDPSGRERRVLLTQHVFPSHDETRDFIPGRLFFDGELVEMRSNEEYQLLHLLRTADFSPKTTEKVDGTPIERSSDAIVFGNDLKNIFERSPEDNLRAFADQIVGYVESDAYLQFSLRVAQASDTNRYNVWIVWEPETRNRIIVRLARLLGTGIPGAREFLDSEAPIATNATALEVVELANQYQKADVPLRTEPQFPWALQ